MAPRETGWFTLDATRVRAFADATEDWQFIHLDADRAAATAFGGPVAHGFLTLSMLSAMSYQVMEGVPGVASSVNYGFDRIRFVSPVRAGQRIRGRFSVAEVVEKPGRYDVTWDVAVEIDGAERPAIVAKWINVLEVET